jgi:hypothetical protein
MEPFTIPDQLNDRKLINEILTNHSVSNDLLTSVLGEFIGEGYSRKVFEYALDNKYVVKVEMEDAPICNITECLIYSEVTELCGNLEWVKDWFAPVKWMSANGRLLLMQRTYEKPNKKKPEKVPKFLWDIKQRNFGWIGGKYMCHDYGQFYNMISYPKRMQKVDWENLI